jgi:hypothetical protein
MLIELSSSLNIFQGASKLGGQDTHCTNWNYVEQMNCEKICTAAGKNDHRVCWTLWIGNYCTCFNKAVKPPMRMRTLGFNM